MQGGQRVAGGFLRDQRPGVGLRVAVPRCEVQPIRQRGHGLDDGVALGAFRHDQAARARAALAGGDEGGLDRDARDGLGIGGVPDDQRVVAAQLQRQDDVGVIGELAAEVGARCARASEHQGVDRLIQQGRAGLAPALHHVEHALGQVGGL